MKIEGFNGIQSALLDFLETKRKETDAWKAQDKIRKKQDALKKVSTDNEKEKILQDLDKLTKNLLEQRKKSLSTEIPDWLTQSAKKAESVNAESNKPMFRHTHPVKFTNPEVDYGGIYVEKSDDINHFLTTDRLKHLHCDISHSNGNLITHSQFLMIELDDETVYEKLKKSDYLWLREFSKDEKQIQKWGCSLSLWVGKKELKNAMGLKQNYFPVDDNYHMLSPLFSSSLCQVIYDRVQDAKFGNNSKSMRKAKKDGVYKEGELTDYPNIAKMNFGGSKPQNITAKNFIRRGDAYLLSCASPPWQSSLKPPISNNMFDHCCPVNFHMRLI